MPIGIQEIRERYPAAAKALDELYGDMDVNLSSSSIVIDDMWRSHIRSLDQVITWFGDRKVSDLITPETIKALLQDEGIPIDSSSIDDWNVFAGERAWVTYCIGEETYMHAMKAIAEAVLRREASSASQFLDAIFDNEV